MRATGSCLELSQTINCHGSAPFKVWFMPIRWYDSTLYDISQELMKASSVLSLETNRLVLRYPLIQIFGDSSRKITGMSMIFASNSSTTEARKRLFFHAYMLYQVLC